MSPDLWCVWLVDYATYDEPNVAPWALTDPMPLDRAQRMAETLGFGFCVKRPPGWHPSMEK
jgi:hypothetical protein